MLILTRRVGETLVIGSTVTVTVAGVRGNQVRIGIEAPKSVRVHRGELYERMQRGDTNRASRKRDRQSVRSFRNGRDGRSSESTN